MKTPDMQPTCKKKRKLRIVCCLSGGQNVGKSETMTAFGQALYKGSRFFYEQKGRHTSPDRRIVLKKKGMIIGICTAGDDQAAIDANFTFFDLQHCDIGFTAARIEPCNDMCAYAQSKANGVRFVNVQKSDGKTSFSQQMIKASVVDHFVVSLKGTGFKDVFNRLNDIH